MNCFSSDYFVIYKIYIKQSKNRFKLVLEIKLKTKTQKWVIDIKLVLNYYASELSKIIEA